MFSVFRAKIIRLPCARDFETAVVVLRRRSRSHQLPAECGEDDDKEGHGGTHAQQE